MNINWKELITKQYWFGLDRGVVHLTDQIILYAGAALVLFGVILLIVKLISKDTLKKPQISRVSSVFITVGLLEMLWYVLRWQYVNALGSRFMAALIGVIGLMFLWKPIKYFLFSYRKDVVIQSKEQLKEKYLNMNR